MSQPQDPQGQPEESFGPSFEAPDVPQNAPESQGAYGSAPSYQPTGEPYGQSGVGAQPAYGEQSSPVADPYGQQQPYPGPSQPAYGQQPYPGPDQSAYGQQPYGQSGSYGAQPGYGVQPTYADPNYGGGYYSAPPEHPQAQTVLILGIVGIFVTITAFIAWYMGAKAKKEIEAGAPYAWSGSLKIGYIIGMVISILVLVSVALIILLMVIGIIGAAMSS